eukprot:CAMPEP_0118637486 /NCGR_PEP_ID=MMETSP0785-20121206/3175_1 /TAXON_ID=91992 /ORGANISM="Bolidomonas pacifica, Strain CCMP 1866" /LENGTH=58 /DNA_ID=CAMNT_0006528669 /DNA_START=167 /DNA_END=340 /DNA_ORIENTATION=-
MGACLSSTESGANASSSAKKVAPAISIDTAAATPVPENKFMAGVTPAHKTKPGPENPW